MFKENGGEMNNLNQNETLDISKITMRKEEFDNLTLTCYVEDIKGIV